MYDHSTMMLGYGAAHWVAMLVVLLIVLYPIGRILRRLGFAARAPQVQPGWKG